MNRRWICGDVWMNILPSFDHAQLGLKMALISDRFDVLVDAHFEGKSELTIWRGITISKDEGPNANDNGSKSKLSEWIGGKRMDFPLPEHPLPNKIRFKRLYIHIIDHSVLIFLRSNKQIWDRSGTKLELSIGNDQQIWDILAREIWPIFASNIRHFTFKDGDHLDNLLRFVSSTILTDLVQLNSIDSGVLFPDGIADHFDGPNAISAWQALAKWLHTPTKNGQPKELRWNGFSKSEWITNFRETFRRATTSVSYKIYFKDFLSQIEPFELVNERTNEKLTLMEDEDGFMPLISNGLLLRRGPIVAETAPVQKQQKNDENLDKLNGVCFILDGDCIGPLSPPGQNDEKVFSLPGPSDQRKKKK